MFEGFNNSFKYVVVICVVVEIVINDGCLLLWFCDNGVGFDFEESEGGGGVGIGSMNECVVCYGGMFDI